MASLKRNQRTSAKRPLAGIFNQLRQMVALSVDEFHLIEFYDSLQGVCGITAGDSLVICLTKENMQENKNQRATH